MLYPSNYELKSIEKIIQELSVEKYLRKYGNESMIKHSNKIDYIASNFYKFNKEEIDDLSKLPKYLLLSIVSSPELKLLNEDSLYEFIKNIFGGEINSLDNEMINDFYEIIEIQNLSFDNFVEMIETLNKNNITRVIWIKLKHILISNFKQNFKEIIKPSRYMEIGHLIEYKGNDSGAFRGIISYLKGKCGGNSSNDNEFNITSSSVNGMSYQSKNAIDFENIESYFCTKNEQNAWIKYDFKDRKVHPTHYSIRTKNGGKGNCHLQNWIIEGSNTDRDDDWKKLDSRNNVTLLDEASRIHTFNIQEKPDSKEFFRYLRLRQTAKNAHSDYFLTLSALEYFGTII